MLIYKSTPTRKMTLMATVTATQDKFRSILLAEGFKENEDGTYNFSIDPDVKPHEVKSNPWKKRTLLSAKAAFDAENPKMLRVEAYYVKGIFDGRDLKFFSISPLIAKMALRRINK